MVSASILLSLAVGLAAATGGGGAAAAPGAQRPASGAPAPGSVGLPPPDPRFQLLGSTACRTCHRALYAAWESSPHGKSFSVLSDDQGIDPGCLPCHSPLTDAAEDNVGCEACHGAGSAYAGLDVMIDPLKSSAAGLKDPTASCTRCHNPNHPFHVERDLEAAARRIHRRPGQAS